MKEGLHIGYSKSMTLEVTEDLFAQFNGEVVHPTFSTVSMVYYMEWVSRELILPFLEDHEEGMGSAVSVKHLAPSGLGTNIEVKATVSTIRERKIITDISVKNDHGLIGVGEVIQAILPKTTINEAVQKVTT